MSTLRVCAGLAVLCALIALGCLGGLLWMIQTVSGLSAADTIAQASQTYSLEVSAVLTAIALGAGMLGLRRRRPLTGYALWLCAGSAVSSSAAVAIKLWLRVDQVQHNIGALPFAVRAPAYADALLIVACGFLAAAVAFGALALLERRRA